MMSLSPCFIDDTVLVDSITWRTKKRGKRALRSLMMVNFLHSQLPWKLFGVVDDGIVVGDDFRRKVKEFDGGEELTVF